VLNAVYTMTIELTVENHNTADLSTVFYVCSVCIEHCILCVLRMCHICDCYSNALYTMTIQLALRMTIEQTGALYFMCFIYALSTVFCVCSVCIEHCILRVLCVCVIYVIATQLH